MSGRPIRFLGVATVGWVGVRAALLWSAIGPAAIPRALVPAAFADRAPPASRTVAAPASVTVASPLRPVAGALAVFQPKPVPCITALPAVRPDPTPTDTPVTPALASPQAILAPPPPMLAGADPKPSRWSASAWFVLRDGRGIAPGLGGGQLGGSQAGLRVAYALGDARRIAIVGRVATPLKGSGREGAIGVEWRPTSLPVRLVAEYRVSLDGGASGPAAGIIAGTGPAPLALGFDLETYGQAGVIRRRRTEPFAEGAARLSLPIVAIGEAKVDLGLGGWGGAQRGAQRLDIGPSLGVRIPVAGKAIRASLDWRQRVAGNARPGSGPVLVIGGDF